MLSGDPATKSFFTSLLRDASRPYMTMLNGWLHYGSIQDPHAEFLVQEQRSLRWERLEEDYTVQKDTGIDATLFGVLIPPRSLRV